MNVQGKKVAIVGLGRTAVSLARLLLREGARPLITEQQPRGLKYESLCAELDALGVPCEMGGHTSAAVDGVALVIPSPGVPPRIPIVQDAVNQGADLVGEMEFAFGCCRSKIIAVTGTNGKTTTTELLRTLVEACGHTVALAGNNDRPFSDAVILEPAPEYIVLEVSSYQLETARTFRPWIAAVLNVTPDHLKRHGTLDMYAQTKARIFANQRQGDTAIVNQDDARVCGMAVPDGVGVCPFSLETRLEDGLWLRGDEFCFGDAPVARTSDTQLRGRHNFQNVLAALAAMRAGGFDCERTLEGLRTFPGVEHRIEYVTRLDGVDFFNDSKSTNIDSLKVALDAFAVPVILIAGGQGKGGDYRVLRGLIQTRVRKMIAIGEDAPALEEAFGDLVPTERASDMADAVRRAGQAARSGDAVLLSPACASFDMYDNFEHRGRVFKECVRDYVRQSE